MEHPLEFLYLHKLLIRKYLLKGISMKKILPIISTIILTSCTYTITLVHTEGVADDVVDTTSANEPKVDPTITIPAV